MPFSLQALVRDVIDTTDTPDIDVLVGEAFGRIRSLGEAEMCEALAETLRPYVRERLVSQRRSLRPKATQSGMSWKVTSIREGRRAPWDEFCHQNIHVGHGERKFLRDCTYADLLEASRERSGMAKALQREAHRYQAYADLVRIYGVATFGELPSEAQEQILEGKVA